MDKVLESIKKATPEERDDAAKLTGKTFILPGFTDFRTTMILLDVFVILSCLCVILLLANIKIKSPKLKSFCIFFLCVAFALIIALCVTAVNSLIIT